MSKEKYMPGRDDKKKTWLHTFASNLPTYNVKYGISAGEVSDMQNSDNYFSFWFDLLESVVDFKEKTIQFKNELRSGVPSGATGTTPPVPPVFGAAPTAVEPGIFDRAASIGNRIKKHKDYVVSDGNNLGLEGAEKPAPDLVNAKPAIKIVLIAGKPEIRWTKGLYDALHIEVDRDGTGYRFLAIDTEPDYSDTFALPVQAATWKYRAIYIFHDEKVGMWSDEVSVTVKA